MKINNNTAKLLKPYLIVVILFLFTGYLFNAVETFSFCKTQEATSFLTILQSFFNITTVFCLYALIILPFYLLVGLLKQKLAQIVTAVLFSILMLLEIGLYIYYKEAGVLMGTDLVVRPITETLTTIRNSSNIIINVILISFTIAYFIVLPLLLKKVKIFNTFRSSVAGVIIIGILSAFIMFYQKDDNKLTDNYLESKSFYFFSSLRTHLADEVDETKKDETLFEQYAQLYPHRTIPDWDYPLERLSSEIADVLSPYFRKSEQPPNIVIVIAESLGNYFLGEKGKNVSFMPFLDSLASSGLYWKNCLATTPRTFGVVPSVVASAPHGMRGFQFGIMPIHHSLFTVLKNNDYATNFFHGGDPNFDSMLDFLTRQEIDHIDDFRPQLRAFRKKGQANYWALYDHILFNESFNYLKTLPTQKPKVNVYLTLTTHDLYSLSNKELKAHYEAQTEKIFSKLYPKQKDYFLSIKDIIVLFTYLDDCIKGFINDYSKQPDFENTIFIITGDHSYGIHKNDLAHYSVPLIIWSPLLKTPKSFPNIVSHLAITPSIVSLLQNSYGLKVPENISWYSDELDTTSIFNPSEKFLILSYERKVNAMVYNQYFFQSANQKVSEIDENLDLHPIRDSILIEDLSAKFNALKYINNYVYHNDKLAKNDKYSGNKYKIIKDFENDATIVCQTPDTLPSVHGIDTFYLMPAQKISGKFDKIKIKFSADIIINDLLNQDQYMMLNFICWGKDYKYASKENITKYIVDENILQGEKYELSIEKEIDVSEIEQYSVQICVTTNEKNNFWKPDKKITLSNTRVLILGK